jgi:hypothetical protein
MKRALPAFMLILILSGMYSASAGSPDTTIDAILDSAEALFRAMKAGDYKGIWSRLSEKSRAAIVNDSGKAIAAQAPADYRYSKEVLEKDFNLGGPVARYYWDAYLRNFNPDWLLEQSRWQMGEIATDDAEVLIRYRKGEGPVHLKMIRENGKWKVGLMETFPPSKQQ